MKTVSLALTLTLCPGIFLAGCNKSASEVAATSPGASAPSAGRSASKSKAAPLLTKEEVAAVLGQPVTTIEGTGSSLTYKTDVMGLETGIEVDRRRGDADAVQSMEGARKATGMLGGEAEAVPGLGDEALFGAMSTLYVRKGSVVIHIQPPNLQQVAGFKAASRMQSAAPGSDEQLKALEELKQTQKGDPLAAGLSEGNAMQGALATIKASSKKQGTQYETDARAMAVALAARVLEKL